MRLWRAGRRNEYLKDKCCVVCGSIDRLEIDHINPDEKISHNIWSWSKDRREAELAKCQVLCFGHHLEKTQKWWESKKVHGLNMYERHGCRCEICRQAKSEKNAQRRRGVNG